MTNEVVDIDIFTDGACRGNPGPGGWGVILRSVPMKRSCLAGSSQQPIIEWKLRAAIEGLAALKRPSRVTITTDSQYVRQGITQWIEGWKRNQWRTSAKKPVKNQDLWQLLDELTCRHEVTWEWVKGHSGHPDNELADVLANRGIDELSLD